MTGTMTDPTQDELVRSRHDRVIAGVAGGLARKFGVGVGWIRVAFVVMLAFGGVGALAYGIGWLVIREEGDRESILDNWIGDLDNSSTWLGAGLVALAAILLLGATDLVRGDMVFAAGLFLFGLLLYRGKLPNLPGGSDRGAKRKSAPPPVPPEEPMVGGPAGDGSPDTTTEAGASVGAPTPALESPSLPGSAATGSAATGSALATTRLSDAPDAGDPIGPPDWDGPESTVTTTADRPKDRRPPSLLGRLTFAAMLMTLGVMAVLDNLDIVDLELRHYVAASVLVTGGGLLVGTFIGRARGLIALGLLLIPLLIFSSAVHVDVFGEYGDRLIVPQSTAEIEAVYEIAGGRIVLDLTDLDPTTLATGEPVTIDANVGMGEIVVYVPTGLPIVADARVGLGRLDIAGDVVSDRGGFDLTQSIDTAGDGEPVLILDLEVGIGNLEMRTS